jgi:small subunit ribosomal protein S2
MKALLESGVHFGHQTRRWNPRMGQFIFTARNGIHIIDLQKTMQRLKIAYAAMKDISGKGGRILFIGTKKQAQAAIEEYAQKCGMFYVSERWLGGLLTNFNTVSNSIARLKSLEKMNETGIWEAETKKEILELNRELTKKKKILNGIKDMAKLPDAVFIIDPKRESIAVYEARKLGIPIFAVVDTNCNPDEIDFPVPGNDDAIRAIALFLDVMARAVIEGQSGGQAEAVEGMEEVVETAEVPAEIAEGEVAAVEETPVPDAAAAKTRSEIEAKEEYRKKYDEEYEQGTKDKW